MDFSDNTTKIILALIAIFAVGIAVTITIRKKKKTIDKSQNLNNVTAGVDVVLGDKKTNINE